MGTNPKSCLFWNGFPPVMSSWCTGTGMSSRNWETSWHPRITAAGFICRSADRNTKLHSIINGSNCPSARSSPCRWQLLSGRRMKSGSGTTGRRIIPDRLFRFPGLPISGMERRGAIFPMPFPMKLCCRRCRTCFWAAVTFRPMKGGSSCSRRIRRRKWSRRWHPGS